MILKAFAKINLGLRILERRPDGFHNLESIFCYINWYDDLVFTPSGQFQFTCSDPSLPTDEGNLVVKAVRLVEETTGKPFSFQIHLEKRIPHGAGLGGGSSDAAAVFRFAMARFPETLHFEKASELAARLGSDLNFFLLPVTQYATGRGTTLSPVDFFIPGWVLTVFPGIPVPTGWAYQQIKPYNLHPLPLNQELPLLKNIRDFSGKLVNDFDAPVSSQKPEILQLKTELAETRPEYLSLSGSGSACFAIYQTKSQAEEAFRIFSAKYPSNLTPPGFKPD